MDLPPTPRLEFWQAAENGRCDNAGYRYRGHQTSGADSSCRLGTAHPRPPLLRGGR